MEHQSNLKETVAAALKAQFVAFITTMWLLAFPDSEVPDFTDELIYEPGLPMAPYLEALELTQEVRDVEPTWVDHTKIYKDLLASIMQRNCDENEEAGSDRSPRPWNLSDYIAGSGSKLTPTEVPRPYGIMEYLADHGQNVEGMILKEGEALLSYYHIRYCTCPMIETHDRVDALALKAAGLLNHELEPVLSLEEEDTEYALTSLLAQFNPDDVFELMPKAEASFRKNPKRNGNFMAVLAKMLTLRQEERLKVFVKKIDQLSLRQYAEMEAADLAEAS